MKAKCPSCATELNLSPVAKFQEQMMYVSLKYEGEFLSLTTAAKTLDNMDKLLRQVAIDVGQRAHVFLKSVEQKENEIVFGLFVAEVKRKKRSKTVAPAIRRGGDHG